ncbi:MAG TPA: 30S ribosomal protein S9 [Lentisphaeria bacterium]|nr:MAG: 30S ribosomal protein S9 [Lentisphaerae bacterium GWF2_49_21]HBC87191.1 30S ribosomal protein S9 [Lentisphaeria bacterium]
MSTQIITATGRRKEAISCVRLQAGTGKIKVNGKPYENYFTTEAIRGYINQPLVVTSSTTSVDIDATLKGGGLAGQAGALRFSIARALIKKDPSLRPVLKNSGMLTSDARVKERKKPGQPGARRRFQFSKR